jgi:SM-20-related protein
LNVLRPSWGERTANHEPFRWLDTAPGELFDTDTAAALERAFPVDGFHRADATGPQRSKTYRNYSRPLVDNGVRLARDTPPLWDTLVTDLCSAAYREQVASLLGQPVARAVEVRLVRHVGGDWLSPHTDRPDKAFSHIFYFNACWRSEWGGCLEILTRDDPSAVVARVRPALGTSVLMARADNSWHQVSAVSATKAPDRLSLLVHGLW